VAAQSAHSDALFRHRIRRLHHLGPRPLGELIGEVLTAACPRCCDLVLDRVERYGEMDPDLVRWLGADDWLEPAAVVRLVSGCRP
jgi:hypothetical protein